MKLTQEIVKELLYYDPETGKLTWRPRGRHWFTSPREWEHKRWNTRYSETEAGSINGEGYVSLKILGVTYQAHQIICLWMSGEFPEEVDHENHIRHDNRWSNLKPTTKKNNALNRKLKSTNTTGYSGVTERNGKYTARVGFRGKRYDLGIFDTPEEAHYICQIKRQELGFHINHGN